MKRSFKAATVFAGVGAATAIFAPAALAAPMHAATATKPDIGPWRECGANNGGVSNWVHLYYPNDDHPAECVGGAGNLNAAATIYSFCPGNNNGFIYGSHSFSFNAGHGRKHVSAYDHGHAGNDFVDGISIYNWTSHAKCT
jgi:hypothetical protein